RDKVKKSVGRLEKVLCILETFFVVAIEDLRIRLVMQNHCKFPCEVVAVLYPRVHSLRTRRCVNVRRISSKKASSLGKLVYVTRVNFVSREPVHIRDVEFELGIAFYLLFDLFVEDFAFVLCKFFRESTD